MKKLRKISISELIKGYIFNSKTIQDKENNTYSASVIDDKVEELKIKTTINVMPVNKQQVTVNIPGLQKVINVYCHEATITNYPARQIIGFSQNGEDITVRQAGTMQYSNYFTIVYV